eukprot:2037865-Rhodomonas_salina.5
MLIIAGSSAHPRMRTRGIPGCATRSRTSSSIFPRRRPARQSRSATFTLSQASTWYACARPNSHAHTPQSRSLISALAGGLRLPRADAWVYAELRARGFDHVRCSVGRRTKLVSGQSFVCSHPCGSLAAVPRHALNSLVLMRVRFHVVCEHSAMVTLEFISMHLAILLPLAVSVQLSTLLRLSRACWLQVDGGCGGSACTKRTGAQAVPGRVE